MPNKAVFPQCPAQNRAVLPLSMPFAISSISATAITSRASPITTAVHGDRCGSIRPPALPGWPRGPRHNRTAPATDCPPPLPPQTTRRHGHSGLAIYRTGPGGKQNVTDTPLTRQYRRYRLTERWARQMRLPDGRTALPDRADNGISRQLPGYT